MVADLFAAFSFKANPGTDGEAAVPAKSPVNWIFPLVVASASTMVLEVNRLSTYVFVAVDIGLFKSEVFSTLLKPRFALTPAAEVAPVPPLAKATTPETFPAVIAAFAKGTEAIGSFDNSSN